MTKYLPALRANIFLTLLMLFAFGATVSAQAPTSLQYPGPNVYLANLDNVFLAPTVSGNIVSYTISPALPTGLSFNTNTGVISGLPTVISPATPYTIVATNAAGTTSTTLSLQIVNYYFDNANAQVSFLAANAVAKVTGGAIFGETQGDIVLYTNVATISGQAIDCIVTTRTVTNVTSWNAYDQSAVSGGSFSNNDDHFFSPQITFGAAGGNLVFDFQFILGGSYNNATNTGTNVVLENVQLNTYDIDGNGTAIQYNEFGGFNTSELGTTTNELVSFDAATGLTKYTSNTATNTVAVTDPKNRIRVSYNEMSNFSIAVGADNSGLAFFFLDFSAGPAFTTVSTPAPSLDLNTNLVGVNNGNSGCASGLNFTGGAGQTNAASTTNLVEFSMNFPTAQIVNGANEILTLAGATSGGSIPLNFANAAAIPSVVFGTTITYGVTATVAGGISTLTFARTAGTSQFTLAAAENLVDALQYINTAVPSTNGPRNFTVNIRNANFKSPDAIFTATLNCVSLSGNIYHDANALTDNLVNPNSTTGQFANGSMYAVLTDQATNLVTKTQALAGSAYNFGTAVPGKYYINFSNSTPPLVGATFSASTFPVGGYYSTGENLGSGAGQDKLVDGRLVLTVGSMSVTNANFGLQIPPTATGVNQSSSLNPGGYNYKTITGTNFGAADVDGTVTSITITGFPTNTNYLKVGSTIYSNGGPCAPQSTCTPWPGSLTISYSAGAPVSSISIDPIDGNTTAVISYTSTDNGTAVSTGSTIQVPFTVPATPLTITGNVWDDANGDGIMNGAEALTNAAGGGQVLYALLIQTTNTYSGANTIFTTTPVNAGSGYTFTGVPAGNDYMVRIISLPSAATDGSAETTVASALAPAYTGVSTSNSGTIATGFNTNNLVNTAPAFNASKANVNFGIEQLPTAIGASHTISQPVYNDVKSLTAANGMSALTGNDGEDGVLGTGAKIKIISVAGLNGNVLKYSGTTMAANSVISNYIPGNLTMTFVGSGSLNASFTFVFVDNAGLSGLTPATYTINWSSTLAVSLVSFNAIPVTKAVKLDWQTANESSIANYAVQRSADGVSWQTITTQAPHGSGSYTANDAQPLKGINYYRLQITGQNGSVTYSGIRKVIFNTDIKTITAWPNPVSDRLSLSTNGSNTISNVEILNITGQTVLRAGNSSANIDMSSLAAGSYLARITCTDNSVTTVQVMKK